MRPKNSKWTDLWRRLKTIYRFQIIDEKTYDVKLVFDLNRLNVIIATGLLLAVFTLFNFILIAYTPLKQYIPGYGYMSDRKKVIDLNFKTEKLEDELNSQRKYYQSIRNIFSDKIVVDAMKTDIEKVKLDSGIMTQHSENEDAFVNFIEKGLQNAELMESIRESKTGALNNLRLHKPVSGAVVAPFVRGKTTSVGLATQPGDPVTAMLDGRVVFAGKTADNSGTIIIQHANQLLTVYKNINPDIQKTGNFVQEGDAIGTGDKSGKMILELWYKSQAVDPTGYFK